MSEGRGRIKHSEFLEASGEKTREEFTRFLSEAFSTAVTYSVNGAIHFVCMDLRHTVELQAAGEEIYTELKNICVWVKTNAGMGTFYRSQYELVFVFKSGDAAHINNFELGQHGRNRSNVWTYAGVNSFRIGRMDDLSAHPTVKPVALVADAIRDCSRRGDIVLDPFMGSGTTILAAERVGRRGFGLELDPRYVDVAIRRWQNYTKRDAIQADTGQTFDETTTLRASERHGRRSCSAKRKPSPSNVRAKARAGDGGVGYGKPPREHQFAPGQSGNPKGRPRGSKTSQPSCAKSSSTKSEFVARTVAYARFR